MRMYRDLVIAIALGGVAAGMSPPGPTGTSINVPADLAEIERIERLVQPVVNIDDVIGFYAADAVTLDLWRPGVYRGRRQIRDGFAAWLAPVATMKLAINDMQIVQAGDHACALMQLGFTTTMKDGSTLTMSTRSLDAYRRIAGRWQIVQQQVALPLSPTDRKAVMREAMVPPGPAIRALDFVPGPPVPTAQAERELARWTQASDRASGAAPAERLYASAAVVYGAYLADGARGAAAAGRLLAADNRASGPAIDLKVERIGDGRFATQVSTRTVPFVGADGRAAKAILRDSTCLVREPTGWRALLSLRSNIVDVATREVIPAPVGALDQAAPVAAWDGRRIGGE